jgi:hypothetical protein
LFYSLLLTIAAGPLLDALGLDAHLLELFLVANLLAAVVPMDSRTGRTILLVILVSAWIVRLGADWLGHSAISVDSLVIWTVIALCAAAGALRFALSATSVDREHIYAALSAYVLAGTFFGLLYWVLDRALPGSLVVAGRHGQDHISLNSAIYFSFVTLATLGYGDVLPGSELARGFAIVEAVSGQLYLAVMIARLVSLYVREVRKGKDS